MIHTYSIEDPFFSAAWLDKLGGASANRTSSFAFNLHKYYACVAGHGARGEEGLVQSLVEAGDDILQAFALVLDRQRFFGGYNVPPFCGIIGIFYIYYGMAIGHRSQDHKITKSQYFNDLQWVRFSSCHPQSVAPMRLV